MIPEPPKHLQNLGAWAASLFAIICVLSAVFSFGWWLHDRMQGKDEPPPAVFDGPPEELPQGNRTDGNNATNATQEAGEEPPFTRGWDPKSRDDNAEWTAQQASFQLVSKDTGEPVVQDNSRANVRLWLLKQLLVAQPPPNGPQLTGDCTSWAFCHAVEMSLAGQMGEWKRLFPSFNYGAGRVFIQRDQLRQPLGPQGCSVAAVARSGQQFGTIAWDIVEAHGYRYSGNLADQWGWNGPPRELLKLAAANKVLTVAPLTCARDFRDSVCNAYGTCFGSDFTAGNFREVDGRIVADNIAPDLYAQASRFRDGSNQQREILGKIWHHAMCCDAYDGTAPSGPKYHIQNSWYPKSHPDPIDDSPVCGFWVEESTMEYIAGKKDAFAVSDVQGFVARPEPRNLLERNLFDEQCSAFRVQCSGKAKTVIAP